ncbi:MULTISPECIES: type II secretion system secretin GspD [unclassified Alcanivorax]|jgi:general secretion pathway protein D|uniref:type II secretion system secretin GspD n=2 Tax=Alcanivorax TaxID=59753 RepID=UPI00089FC298|nr:MULTISPECIES: type II secretion system secretin GspD [unclassified Alcanivorax]MED5239568.1 type II secretion system secretin GspD [Pseudomonadota bacterium]MEE2601428.1 type II secretion system secretin GspD [Pseudomonadota bacterium]MEE3389157.1 type II secretion system secretin GspD [Pseudomonadota bacterium]SEG21703.1 general secretion pathway protein D [Alcanivorax sp. DSM 26293]
MMSFFKASALRTLIVVLLSATALTVQAQVAASEDGKSWTVNIRNADIQAFISQIADMTGKNFVVDPRVRARDVTVVSTKALSATEVYELFLSVLQVHGYAAVPSGDIIKIVPNTTAKQSNLPLVGENESGGEALVTRVIPVENSPVEELVPVLRPLVPQYGHLAAVGSANALIISDHIDNIRRMEAIIASLDNAESEDVQVIKLEHAFAGDMVKMLESLTPQTGGRRGKTKDGGVTVVADERTNRLIIKGDRITRQRMAQMIRNLDTPASATGGVQVVRLSHGDAEALAELLKNFAEGASAAKPGADGKTAAAAMTGDKVSIQADKSLNALVIRAEPAMMKEIMSVISQLDVRRAQILIEAAIVEVSGDTGKALGFQYVGGSDESGVGAINFGNAGLTINSIVQALATDDPSGLALGDGITMGFGEQDSNGDLKWGALIQALSTSTDVNLLSTPSILTLDNQEASIVVGENVPFITGTSTSTGSGVSNPFQTIQREDVGLSLKVTPHVAGLSTIRLELEQENSQVKDSVGEAADIVTTTRKLESTVLADDGETIALGGLIRDNITKTVRKVPILGDIPLLGILFRSTSNSREKSNLMVFLRPTILPDNERLLSMTRQKYMGITALQFELNNQGELEQVVRDPLPVSLEQVFEGRKNVSPEFREAYDAQQNAPAKEAEVEESESQ